MQPEQPGFDLKALMQRIDIAEPCAANWQTMTGDERARFCSKCQLHVHNTLEMTDEQVMRALTRLQNGERVCLRIYKKSDGTFLTKSCPFGFERLRLQARRMHARTAAIISGVLAMVMGLAAQCAPAVSAKSKKPLWSGSVCNSTSGVKNKKSKPKNKSTEKVVRVPGPEFIGLPAPSAPPAVMPGPAPNPPVLKKDTGPYVKEY